MKKLLAIIGLVLFTFCAMAQAPVLRHAFTTNSATIVSNIVTLLAQTNSGTVQAAQVVVTNDAYNATTWNGNTSVPTKDDIRDKIETITAGTTYATTNQLWINLVDYGGVGDGVTDNTVALSNAIYRVLGGSNTNVATNGVIYIPQGVWRFTNNPVNFETNENAIIGIPHKAAVTVSAGAPTWSRLEIRGHSPQGYWAGTAASGLTPTNGNGTVLLIDNTNECAFIKSIGWQSNILDQFNFTTVAFNNLTFMTLTNVGVRVLDLQAFACADVGDCSFVKTRMGSHISSLQPSNSIAVEFPQLNCGALNRIEKVNIDGYYIGLQISEHTVGDLVSILGCANALSLKGGNHANSFNHLYTGGSATNILGRNASILYVDSWSIERAYTDWRTNYWDFTDNNNTKGRVNWFCLDNNIANNSRRLRATSTGGIVFVDLNNFAWNSPGSPAIASRGQIGIRFAGDAVGPNYGVVKGRGNSGNPSAASSGDIAGTYSFGGYDGTTYPGIVTAYIAGVVDGSVSSGVVPMRLDFTAGQTTSPGTVATMRSSGMTVFTNLLVSAAVTVTNGVVCPAATISLTADNQVVSCATNAFISLSSDSATATQRTFVLTTGVPGKIIYLTWTGTNAGELADDAANSGSGNVRLSATWTPTQYDTLTLLGVGNDWHEVARSAN